MEEDKKMILKGIALGALADKGLDVVYRAGSALLVPMFRKFSEHTGEKLGELGEEAVEKFKTLLPVTEHDEQIIDDAMIMLDYRELQAWNQKMKRFDELAKDAAGVVDRKRADRLREYYRKLTVKKTVEETAAKMRQDAGMPPKVWDDYLQSLDIEHKNLRLKYDSFLKWAGEHGKSVLEGIKEHGGKLLTGANENRNEVNDAIRQSGKDFRNWVDDFVARNTP